MREGNDVPRHIGIVACSAEGAALCYRTVCAEGAQVLGTHGHPEVSMHTHSLATYMGYVSRGDWAGVGELMLSSAQKLAAAGADFLICPDNTIHQALPHVEPRSPLPWLTSRPSSPRACRAGLPAARPHGYSSARRERGLPAAIGGSRSRVRAAERE